jgi:hypothetical protein
MDVLIRYNIFVVSIKQYSFNYKEHKMLNKLHQIIFKNGYTVVHTLIDTAIVVAIIVWISSYF